ncbi:MAG: disulfide bond formation protein B [Gaiellales bacterium]
MVTFLAVLTVAAQALLAALLLAAIIQLVSAKRPLDALRELLGRDALRIALLVAIAGTAGSLYMSEIRHFPPCPLCWYQRIAMYPLVPILAIAAVINDTKVFRYVLPLTLTGLAVSIYHTQLELFPSQVTIACTKSVPCTTIWFQEFGYITIPVMAGTAFMLVAALTWLGRTHGQGITKQA